MTARTKEEWLNALRASADDFGAEIQKVGIKSPTFFAGPWRVAIEHQRAYKSVVIQPKRGMSVPGSVPEHWKECPPSDQRKGWRYRVSLTPERIKQLLTELVGKPPSFEEVQIAFEQEIERSLRDSPEERRKRLATSEQAPERISVATYVYVRNPDVVAEVLDRAQGVCEKCDRPAPFIRRSNGTPYLEVHHKVRLADGGKDTVDNAIALCPNCHREEHYA